MMSSIHRRSAALLLLTMVCLSVPAQCQDGSEWDRARAQLVASQPTGMAQAISRWQMLSASDSYDFSTYAGFLLAYPGFPDEPKLRTAAEKALANGGADPARIIAFFDRFPPLTNPGRAQYALALATLGRPEAAGIAHAAWRGGSMSDSAEASILQNYGARFTTADYDARIDALLWDGNVIQASRALGRTSSQVRLNAQARLAILGSSGSTGDAYGEVAGADGSIVRGGTVPGEDGSIVRGGVSSSGGGSSGWGSGGMNSGGMAPGGYGPGGYGSGGYGPGGYAPSSFSSSGQLDDPGYVFTRARQLWQSRQTESAASLLGTHPSFTARPLDQRKWIALLLAVARGASPDSAVRVAERVDDSFAPGTDVSQLSFPVRDDYTSLTWLGGTQALWVLHNPERAAALFYRYGSAGRTPQTRAKGFYWAGRALARVGQSEKARRYFTAAAAFPDQFYGMLALERLGQPLPSLLDPPHPSPTPAERTNFYNRPITQAVREVAREGDWQTTIRFFREISAQATTETGPALVAELARSLGRRDLGVVLGQSAGNDGTSSFRDVSFPLMPVPPGSDWTMVHAITRQESQFSQNAVSRTNARGLMQLMPGTASDQSAKLGIPYNYAGLTTNPSYNIELGDAVFSHLMTIYNGCYPLAIAAYNSGPGNVNKWLRDIGDPRQSDNWVDWIEHIPFTETRGYVQHVIENAVVYEALYPAHARYRGAYPASHFLTKRTPG